MPVPAIATAFLYAFDAAKKMCIPPEGVLACGVATSCGSHPARRLKSAKPFRPALMSMSTTTMVAGTAQPKSQYGHFCSQASITTGSDDASLNPCGVSGRLAALTGKMCMSAAA